MKSTLTRVSGVALAAVATALFALPAGPAGAVPGTGQAAGAKVATPPGLGCHTGKHANDEYTGYALCKNNGTATQTFWVHLVCGWAPDVDGNHVTLAPGQSSQSTAHCGAIGTGIGAIEVRP